MSSVLGCKCDHPCTLPTAFYHRTVFGASQHQSHIIRLELYDLLFSCKRHMPRRNGVTFCGAEARIVQKRGLRRLWWRGRSE